MWIEIRQTVKVYIKRIVILRVRMWIEIVGSIYGGMQANGHPPCEDVDWNDARDINRKAKVSHPPCEDVDWNPSTSSVHKLLSGHPPCEDVDWNSPTDRFPSLNAASSSVWGCGLKLVYDVPVLALECHPPCEDVDWNHYAAGIDDLAGRSSSVWGCGLKCPGTSHCKPSSKVILRVRMWIEIVSAPILSTIALCHPPCEDVDWNWWWRLRRRRRRRHPPCEDVDWNRIAACTLAISIPSSSVWGCGLKLGRRFTPVHIDSVILRVRMWIEMPGIANFTPRSTVSSSVWGCGLKLLIHGSFLPHY